MLRQNAELLIMSHQFTDLLHRWIPHKDEWQWVLATIINTQGSSYRKAGAMMLINSLGQYDGLLSGGCLEGDIMRHAKQVMDTQQHKIITYDMQEEDDIGWKLGIGCGGLVQILLQPLTPQNNYQNLPAIYLKLTQRQSVNYQIQLDSHVGNQLIQSEIIEINGTHTPEQKIANSNKEDLIIHLTPPSHIAIFGAGLDAKPLQAMAHLLGWQVSIIDHRTAYARKEHFQHAKTIIKQGFESKELKDLLSGIDAAVIMGHNIDFDSQALAVLQNSTAQYIGLLGPSHRKEKVIKQAKNITIINKPLTGPTGLNIGGELPESIALAILAEIHAFLHGTDARSIDNVLTLGQAINQTNIA